MIAVLTLSLIACVTVAWLGFEHLAISIDRDNQAHRPRNFAQGQEADGVESINSFHGGIV